VNGPTPRVDGGTGRVDGGTGRADGGTDTTDTTDTDTSGPTHTIDHVDPVDRATADEPPMLEVGRIVKPHGLRGDVIVSLATNRPERVTPGSVLSTEDGRPMTVLRSAPHQGRFIVTFEGLSGIDEADRARGTQLFAPPLDDPDALWIHELIGSSVEDTSGRVLGTVDSVEANPASDLLVLDGGALIPLRFVVGNEPGVRIIVEVPDGLLDLS
jgi:16S rRNA processing protein RimM